MEKGFCSISQPYSPELIRAQALGSPAAAAAVAARAAFMLWELAAFAAGVYADTLTGRADDPVAVKARAVALRDMLTRLGPTFIKGGQVLANRPDILREDYMNELCVLQDDVPSFSDAVAFAGIEAQLGRPIGDVFSSISERPVAAASLGQVSQQPGSAARRGAPAAGSRSVGCMPRFVFGGALLPPAPLLAAPAPAPFFSCFENPSAAPP
jgi:hypothetical protein